MAKADAIAEEIRRRIHNGTDRPYAPGAALPSNHELQEEFGVVETTIRNALRKLADAHLVEPPRDWTVRFDASEIARAGLAYFKNKATEHVSDVLKLRRTLEGLAAKRAAQAFDGEAHYAARFKATQSALDEALASKKAEEEIKADLRFHQEIYSLAGSGVLSKTLVSIRTFLYENIEHNVSRLYDLDGYADQNRDWHSRIYHAIQAKDADKAEDLACGHIDFAVEWLGKLPDWSKA